MKLTNKSDLLDVILPEYPHVKTIPNSISQAPGFAAVGRDTKKLQEFEDNYYKQEQNKEYKCMDATGAIYLIKNPAVWRRKVGLKGEIILLRPAPRFLMTFKQALKLAEKQGTVSSPRGFTDSDVNWD